MFIHFACGVASTRYLVLSTRFDLCKIEQCSAYSDVNFYFNSICNLAANIQSVNR